MDTEPDRCRRTDGRKWRCRLEVIPDQKYCERHIHRGRERSRKHVEVKKNLLMSKSTTTSSIPLPKTNPKLQSGRNVNDKNQNNVNINNQSIQIKKHSSKENARAPLESSFSPKGVLQQGNGQHCGPSSNDNNSAVAVAESERCRSTDGKKWLSSKGALPEQKCSEQHMLRGVKKAENRQYSNTTQPLLVGTNYSCQQMDEDGKQPNDSSTISDNDADGSVLNVATRSSEATTISV